MICFLIFPFTVLDGFLFKNVLGSWIFGTIKAEVFDKQFRIKTRCRYWHLRVMLDCVIYMLFTSREVRIGKNLQKGPKQLRAMARFSIN